MQRVFGINRIHTSNHYAEQDDRLFIKKYPCHTTRRLKRDTNHHSAFTKYAGTRLSAGKFLGSTARYVKYAFVHASPRDATSDTEAIAITGLQLAHRPAPRRLGFSQRARAHDPSSQDGGNFPQFPAYMQTQFDMFCIYLHSPFRLQLNISS